MNLSKIIGAVVIIMGFLVGYVGINKVADNIKVINLLGLKIDVSNESGIHQGYLYMALAVVIIIGGAYILDKSKN